jgi:virginiamycin A acetyltransferase
MSGVRIGERPVVGIGSSNAPDVPPYAVAYGNPAKVTRSRISSSKIEKLLKIAWWDRNDDTIKARESDF